MVKPETIGMILNSKNNPTLTSAEVVKNYSFIEDDNDAYVIMNEINGDDAYNDDVNIPIGDYLNGFLLKAWDGQNIIVDEKHITYGGNSVDNYSQLNKGAFLSIGDDKKLKIEATEPTETKGNIYFKVMEKTTLIQKAVKLKVMVINKDTVA